MTTSRFSTLLLLAAATSFAGWKVAYRPGNIATENPPAAFDMGGNLWIWPNVSGTLQQVAQGKDSSATANPSIGFLLPVNFTATSSGRLVTALSYTAIVTSTDSGKRWDTLATVARNYGILAGRGFWMAPSLARYRGKNTTVVLSGSWGSKTVDTLASPLSAGLDLGILPGDIPLVVRTNSTPVGERFMTFHALQGPTDTTSGTILDTIAPKGSQKGLACNAAGCLFATDDSVWVVRSAPFSVTGFPAPLSTSNAIRSLTLTATDAWVFTYGNGTHGVWRRPLSGGSWTLDNGGLGSDSSSLGKLVSDGSRIAFVGPANVYLAASSPNRVVRRAAAVREFSLREGAIALELGADARGNLEVASLDGRILSRWDLRDLGAGIHRLPVAHSGLHVVRLRTPEGETVRTGWSRRRP